MEGCCNENNLTHLQNKHRKILIIVLLINLLMFFVELGAGIVAHSTALLADSLDMLGDAFIYAISLYVIGKTVTWNASVSLAKGIIMMLFGVGVLAEAIHKFTHPLVPIAETMGMVGGLALIANFSCAFLLLRHRADDVNMRSAWLCSRNDVLANLGVLLAAGAVGLTRSKFPDIIVGVAIASLVLKSAFTIVRESYLQLRMPT